MFILSSLLKQLTLEIQKIVYKNLWFLTKSFLFYNPFQRNLKYPKLNIIISKYYL